MKTKKLNQIIVIIKLSYVPLFSGERMRVKIVLIPRREQLLEDSEKYQQNNSKHCNFHIS